MKGKKGEPQVFLIVGTGNSFGDAEFLRRAKATSKPLCILLKRGLQIPSYFLEELGDVLVEEWETKEEIYSATLKLIRRRIEELEKRKKEIL